MELTDTHCHIFLPEFDSDRDEMIQRALKSGVHRFFLPHVDSSTTDHLMRLSLEYPDNCFPLMGLHPTSVEEDFEKELKHVEESLSRHRFFGIGEIGIDLYWESQFQKQQETVFKIQLQWAAELGLPVIIHVRNSFTETIRCIREVDLPNLTGIFHCFTGTIEQAREIIELGFLLGIGGVLTFRNSDLGNVIRSIDLVSIVLETDSPYLAPAPKRGKRNEPAYLVYVADALAKIKGISPMEVARITTMNSQRLFQI